MFISSSNIMHYFWSTGVGTARNMLPVELVDRELVCWVVEKGDLVLELCTICCLNKKFKNPERTSLAYHQHQLKGIVTYSGLAQNVLGLKMSVIIKQIANNRLILMRGFQIWTQKLQLCSYLVYPELADDDVVHSDGDAGVGVVGAGLLEGDVGGALGEDLEVLAPELAADGCLHPQRPVLALHMEGCRRRVMAYLESWVGN